MPKQRNISIDILRFIAVLIITNSHFEPLYGQFRALATGGAIGDALFFFVSGFTLFLGAPRRFDNYYKRRIARIYPTIFAWSLMLCVFWGWNSNFVYILLQGGGWFISLIMIYYFLLFFVRKYFFQHLKITLVVSLIAAMLLYIPFYDSARHGIYSETYYRWCHYFVFMLLGSILGSQSIQQPLFIKNGYLEFGKVLACVAVFYGICAFKSSDTWNWMQVLSLVPLMGVLYFLYRMCNATGMKKLYDNSITKYIIKFIGSLCLEVYLVQGFFITDKLNYLFPLNFIIIIAEIILVAYALHCFGNVWSQTFKDADFDWKKVFKIA